MYSVEIVAKYIIQKSNQMNKAISNLKLQKILYFVQAEFLVVKGTPCFSESIEAWDFGPVVPEAYHKYKIYGSANIPFINSNDNYPFSNKDMSLIDGIVEQCAQYSASALVELTHSQKPWKEAYHQYCNAIITNESIKQYFKET